MKVKKIPQGRQSDKFLRSRFQAYLKGAAKHQSEEFSGTAAVVKLAHKQELRMVTKGFISRLKDTTRPREIPCCLKKMVRDWEVYIAIYDVVRQSYSAMRRYTCTGLDRDGIHPMQRLALLRSDQGSFQWLGGAIRQKEYEQEDAFLDWCEQISNLIDLWHELKILNLHWSSEAIRSVDALLYKRSAGVISIDSLSRAKRGHVYRLEQCRHSKAHLVLENDSKVDRLTKMCDFVKNDGTNWLYKVTSVFLYFFRFDNFIWFRKSLNDRQRRLLSDTTKVRKLIANKQLKKI